MDSKMKIMESFRHYVINHSYSDVTVMELVAASGVSKKTFYKYFDSKQDVLRQVVMEDTVLASQRFMQSIYQEQLQGSTQLAMELQFAIIYQHREFYAALYADKSRSSIRIVITAVLYEFTGKAFRADTADEQPVDEVELDYACWFFASAMANAIEWWIDHDFQPDSYRMATMYNNWTFAYNRENGRFQSAKSFSREGAH